MKESEPGTKMGTTMQRNGKEPRKKKRREYAIQGRWRINSTQGLDGMTTTAPSQEEVGGDEAGSRRAIVVRRDWLRDGLLIPNHTRRPFCSISNIIDINTE